MDDQRKGILGNPRATGEQIRQAWEQAAVAAMENHRISDVPVATWDWDRSEIVLIPAIEASIPDEKPLIREAHALGKS